MRKYLMLFVALVLLVAVAVGAYLHFFVNSDIVSDPAPARSIVSASKLTSQ